MKVAIVTGGSRGLGKDLVDQFYNNGWVVYELSRSGTSDNHIFCDFSDPSSINNVSLELFGKILTSSNIEEIVLINNAATITPISNNSDISVESLITHLNTNITSAWVFIHNFVSKFRDLKAVKKIINLSSGAALKGYPGWSLYCGSKAACENYMNALFLEEVDKLYPFEICNFDPGVMDTDMQKEIRDTKKENFQQLDRFIALKEDGDLLESLSVAKILFTLVSSSTLKKVRYSVNELVQS